MCEHAVYRTEEIGGVGVFTLDDAFKSSIIYSFKELGMVKLVDLKSDRRGGGKVLIARTMEEALNRNVRKVGGEAIDYGQNIHHLRLWYKNIGITMDHQLQLNGDVERVYDLCLSALFRHNVIYHDS